MACGSCQKRKEEFIRKQNELRGIQIEIPIVSKPPAKPPIWKFAKTPRQPKKIEVQSNNHLMALKNAERIQNKLEEIKTEQQKKLSDFNNLPKEQDIKPQRK